VPLNLTCRAFAQHDRDASFYECHFTHQLWTTYFRPGREELDSMLFAFCGNPPSQHVSRCLYRRLAVIVRMRQSRAFRPDRNDIGDIPSDTSVTPSAFHPRLKTHMFHKSFPLLSHPGAIWTAFTDFGLGPCLLAICFIFLVTCTRLS